MSLMGNRRFDENERTYHWVGGFGAVLKSYERRVSVGDTRVISGELMYAYVVYPGWLYPNEVCWTFINPTIEEIVRFRTKVFGGG